MAGQAGLLARTESLSGHPSKQQPRSTFKGETYAPLPNRGLVIDSADCEYCGL
ncbi:hypothetical protein J6590_095589 [Homalodisca vitripennis]|nr:hypothetical protein J6590_065606 [Homalodisca vitripennis]KAG8324299.1 hypothetical protein J6590_095589 [Homalodisca vitripennis]